MLFIIGLIRIWGWTQLHFPARQVIYESGRVAAGSNKPGFLGFQERGKEGEFKLYDPKTRKLNDNWTFRGKIN